MLAARAVLPTIEFKEASVQKAGAALQHAISSADFTGPARAVRWALTSLLALPPIFLARLSSFRSQL